ncbi:hypothetical protein ERO13_D13G075901v2 [Gossypium hirsutum]|uniref:Uncharacterized protein n=1 Tax=Gossypium barbadense TaxID=3634 RepID=A0A5J5NIU3_GOSBA|nr:hypothetical protein ES319_D13G084700v1 [Gossypium barbadense]KAG4110921.1 hypothetical protein ERO13_D13G075901v2 [Gossypium hirsutum]
MLERLHTWMVPLKTIEFNAGNGRLVNFIMDNWISRLGSFHRYLRQSTVVLMKAKVANVTDPKVVGIEMY